MLILLRNSLLYRFLPDKASISSMIIDGDFVMTEEKERDIDDYFTDKRRKRDIDPDEEED